MEEDIKKEFGKTHDHIARLEVTVADNTQRIVRLEEAVTDNTQSIVRLEEAVTTNTRSIVLLEDKVVDGNRLLKDIISVLRDKPSRQELPCEDHDERLKVLEFHASSPTKRKK